MKVGMRQAESEKSANKNKSGTTTATSNPDEAVGSTDATIDKNTTTNNSAESNVPNDQATEHT